MTRYMFLVLAVASLGACSTAGPYVTNISSDGDWGLTVEKCKVHMNAFMGTVSTGDCSTQNLKLQSGHASDPKNK